MKKLVVSTLIASSLLCGSAQAADYYLAMMSKEAAWFIDVSSIRTVYGDKRFWIASVNSKTEGSAYTMIMVQANCTEQTYKFITLTSYNDDGTVIGTESGNNAVQYVIPGTLGESAIKMACSTSFPDDSHVGDVPPTTLRKAMLQTEADKAKKAK